MQALARLFLLAALALPAVVHPRVAAPPLPPGSDRVQVEPGLNEAERARAIRAHRTHRARPAEPVRPRGAASAPPATTDRRK